MGQIHLILPL